MEQNLTTGSVFRNVVRFSLPYLLAYFLQTLYGMADLFIVGQYEGVAATTAVSIGSQVMHMLTVMLVGLAMGTTVSIARAVGAGNRAEAAKATGNTVTLFAVVSLALTAVLLLLVRPITAVMSTPAEAVDGTAAYLTICFCGIPFITAYNILGSIFRGMGDSKSPMYFVAVACAANIALDYFFMGALHMGPAGAALGTTLSQALSVLIALLAIRKRRMISLQKSDLRPQKAVMGQILRIGLPVLAQDGLVQIGFLIITIIANQRGLTDAAAVGIVEKFISFVFLVPSSLLSTVSALAAQNLGADKPERAADPLGFHCPGPRLRRRGGHRDPVLRVGCRRPVHARRGDDRCRRELSARLYLRLHVRRYPLLLQRLFLRVRQIGPVVPAQHPRHCAHPCPGRVSDVAPLPADAVAHGPRHSRRFALLGHPLHAALPRPRPA